VLHLEILFSIGMNMAIFSCFLLELVLSLTCLLYFLFLIDALGLIDEMKLNDLIEHSCILAGLYR
jgi:hypothetical protein